jgi:DNA-directed RNA polymerase specialized sigma24 family protein
MGNDYDLDVTFDDVTAEPDLSTVSAHDLEAAIVELPEAIRLVAIGLLVEKRTMSDVSQSLGIRQSELVSRLHRAKIAIGTYLEQRGTQ